MALSSLQKFILKRCLQGHKKVTISEFVKFYPADEYKKDHEQVHKIIRKSIDRLIAREFMLGYGSKTPHKLYIKEIRLTPKGRKAAKQLLPKQQKLPLK